MENQRATRVKPGTLLAGFGWFEGLKLNVKTGGVSLMRTQGAERETHESEHSVLSFGRPSQSHAGSKTILLISDDKQLHGGLRSLANSLRRIVVRAEGVAGTVAILQATRPAAVLLDLDLPDGAAWETAELLLQEPSCPPVILLTARTEQFDIRTAIHARCLINKCESPSRLLEAVDEALELPETNQAERNDIQRVLIGWLKPSGWGPTTPVYRFWGINE